MKREKIEGNISRVEGLYVQESLNGLSRGKH